MNAILAFPALIGAMVLRFAASVGRVVIFGARTASHVVRPPIYPRELAVALLNIGWLSLPVVGLRTN